MSSPFQPADGVSSRASKLYDLVLGRNVGDEITYHEAETLLECDHQGALAAMRDARARLERDQKQSVRTVSSYGWIVMRAGEHLDESERHQRKAHTQAKISARKLNSLRGERRAELSPFERQRFDYVNAQAAAALIVTGRKRLSLDELGRLGQQPKPLPGIGA